MTLRRSVLVLLVALLLIPHVALAQATLGPGPKVSIQLVAHPIPTHPQWSKVDLVYYKEIIPQRSGGRVEVKGATWAEMNIKGDEIIRMARQGQIDIGGSPLTYLAGDVPLLDVADLAGLNPTVEQARKVTDAVVSPSSTRSSSALASASSARTPIRPRSSSARSPSRTWPISGAARCGPSAHRSTTSSRPSARRR